MPAYSPGMVQTTLFYDVSPLEFRAGQPWNLMNSTWETRKWFAEGSALKERGPTAAESPASHCRHAPRRNQIFCRQASDFETGAKGLS
jgi:hypothetical protein